MRKKEMDKSSFFLLTELKIIIKIINKLIN